VSQIGGLLHDGYAASDVAVFYRTNAQSRVIEDLLRRHDIAYQVVGGLRFYDRAEVKDALAYLQVLINPSDAISLRRIINAPRRGIGDTTVSRLIQHAEAFGMTREEEEHHQRAEGANSRQHAANSRVLADIDPTFAQHLHGKTVDSRFEVATLNAMEMQKNGNWRA